MNWNYNAALKERMPEHIRLALPCIFTEAPYKDLPAEVASFYDDRDVFCAARHPFDRITSSYCHHLNYFGHVGGALDNVAGLNYAVKDVLRQFLSGDRYVWGCH